MVQVGRQFQWAQSDVDPNNSITKQFPPPENVTTGLLSRQPWPRLWHNAAMANYGEWLIHYRDTVHGIGSTLMYVTGSEPAGTVALTDELLGWGYDNLGAYTTPSTWDTTSVAGYTIIERKL